MTLHRKNPYGTDPFEKEAVTAATAKLLKDKRDELMRQFLDMVRENKALRERVEAGILAANKNFVLARAGMDDETTSVALDGAEAGGACGAGTRNVMSVNIPVFDFKTRTASETDIFSYGFAFTSADLDYAVQSLADVLPDMLKLAETEKVLPAHVRRD